MYIYKTTCLVNGKIYIGQSSRDVEKSKNYFGSGNLILKAIDFFGKDNFSKEILRENISSYSELNNLEAYYISKFNSTDEKIGYNISAGGNGGNTAIRNVPEISINGVVYRSSGDAAIKLGLSQSLVISRARSLSKSFKNWYYVGQPKTIIEMDEEQEREFRKKFSKPGVKNPFYGKHHSEKTKERLRESSKKTSSGENNGMFGKKHNEEAKQKISKKLSRKVSVEGVVFSSTGEVAKKYKISKKLVQKRIHSKSESFKNWFYLEQDFSMFSTLTQEERKNKFGHSKNKGKKLSKQTIEKMRERGRKLSAEGVIYKSIGECAEIYGVHKDTVLNRIKSTKNRWDEWFYIENK